VDILYLIGTLAVVITLILYFTEYLDNTVAINTKNQISSALISFPNMSSSDIIKSSNEVFLQLFDKLYVTNSRKNLISWIWIICSAFTAFSFGLIFNILLHIRIPLENLLTISIIFPSITITLFFLSKVKRISCEDCRFFNIAMILLLIFSMFGYFSKFYGLFLPPSFFEIAIIEKVALQYGLPKFPIYDFIFTLIILIQLIFIIPTVRIINDLHRISPIRAMISSIIFLAFISGINKDVAQSFISDFNHSGMILLAYIFLNLFGDTISLYETNIVLRVGLKKATLKFFSLLLLFDFLLSALIFLAIPISTGNADIFFESILFKGDIPWLGLLFWSTFFTSIVFWFYLFSIGFLTYLQRIFIQYEFDTILRIKEKPFHCLGIVAIIPITPIIIILHFI